MNQQGKKGIIHIVNIINIETKDFIILDWDYFSGAYS